MSSVSPAAKLSPAANDRRVLWLSLIGGVLSVIYLGPALLPGYVLVADMVFVPDMRLTPSIWGVSYGSPRSVPTDVVVALLDNIIPAQVVQKLALMWCVWGLFVGVSLLVPRRLPLWVAVTAGLVAVMSPYLSERMLMGHWSLLVGHAALPWLIRSLLDAYEKSNKQFVAPIVWWTAVTSISPSSGLISGTLVLIFALLWAVNRQYGLAALLLVSTVVLNSPWIVAGLLHTSSGLSSGVGAHIFAARSDHVGPAVLSLLDGGGIWNVAAVPASRASVMGVVVTITVCLLTLVGVRSVIRSVSTPQSAVFVWAATWFVLAALGTTEVGKSVITVIVQNIPGGGIVRDGQKFVGPWAIGIAVMVSLGVWQIANALIRRGISTVMIAVAAVVGPLIMSLDVLFGISGVMKASDYPQSWRDIDQHLASHADADDLLIVLPASAYRIFEWNDSKPVLDPAGRYFGVDVQTDDRLKVGSVVVPGENSLMDAVGRELNSPTPEVSKLGIRWIVMHRSSPRQEYDLSHIKFDPSIVKGDLVLYEARGSVADRDANLPWVLISAYVAWIVTVVFAISAILYTKSHSKVLPFSKIRKRTTFQGEQ